MRRVETDVYDELPDDPEDAFVYLASYFKEECDQRLRQASENENYSRFYVDYISKIIAAVKELGIEHDFSEREVPKISSLDYDSYLEFNKDVEHYITGIRIRRVRRQKGIAVSFDVDMKDKLNGYLGEIRNIISRLDDVTQDKKEVLLKRVNDLRDEIDRDRTGLERFGGVAMAVSGIIGESIEKAQILKLLDKVGFVLWGKQNDRPRLPSPPKQIEHRTDTVNNELDDDIPF